jgi:phenylacetate-coenzyme A ligase PaaK-like adenylate-forming protein
MKLKTKLPDLLFQTNSFSTKKEDRQLFVDSYRECCLHHYKHNELFKFFFDQAKFHPHLIKREEDLKFVPPILVNVFKENELKSVSDKEIKLILTSSGTSGQKSQMILDELSLERVKKLVYKIHEDLEITSNKKYNYLCFSYDPKVANDLGTAFSDETLTSFTPKNEVYYAIQWDKNKNEFALNEQGVVEKLIAFSKSKFPTRILGFPAFLYKIISDHQLKLHFHKDSWIQTGGGWKNHHDQEIPKYEFRNFMEEHLGIPIHNIRDMFGMVEHGIPYVDCELGNLHIPNFSRVFIRSPQNLEIVREKEIGLIHFLASYNTSYPSVSLLTTDWGSVDQCNCKRGGRILKLHGRAGVNKHKGCALKSLDLLKGK